MDHISSTPCDFVVDLEMCKSPSEEAASPDPIQVGKSFFNNICDDEELVQAENGLCMISNVKDKVKGLVADNSVEKKKLKDKRKSTSAKKPPRPPRGLSLDAADQKLIEEIAELTMIKRARIERIKALKKLKAAKASSTSSSTGSVLAFLFTVIFFLVLCFQGMSSGSSVVSSHDSPQPLFNNTTPIYPLELLLRVLGHPI
ncbi:uncharacterized protein LOC132626739 [Lycium barbarum]|uniref:uncharacterized protein LOC132626739 n=1 Tax=Lycium barbarum TaxID=112863 RepID=UPI00293E0449|nr:uncharacterized protein LOC132626739 [Lycium barbarum]XP_060197699.1 uncharacterized protein LOC132626739 [Lycium barbarum]XP_060197700.1 uncharacterized protein LOC132626739 [Lycium barbarum]